MINTNSWRNPYIIGRPIREPQKFFGREDLFPFIEDNLNSNTNILLLHGQRRIGKSSVLEQLTHKIAQDKFVFVCFDLQEYGQSPLSDILYKLAEKIYEELGLYSDITPLPSEEQFQENLNVFSDEFLPRVYEGLGNKKLVLLLDEFDVVIIRNSFFEYLKLLLIKQTNLFIIPVIGRFEDDLKKLFQLFNSPPYQEIGLLNEPSSKRLIIRQAQGTLEYEEDAIQAILRLSSGHPYFTQAICFNLFLQAKFAKKPKITREDVEGIVDKTIESVTGGLAWFWDGLSVNEKVFFSAVAEVHKIAIEQKKWLPEEPLTHLKNYGVIQTEELIQTAPQLVEKGYLDETERRVKIELVRRWLVQYHPMNQEIFQLQKIKQEEINRISEQETQLYRDGNIQDIIAHYEEILTLNPNHFTTISVLAQRYLEVENFDNALTLYTRAYQVNPIQNKEKLLQAREAYGKSLRTQRELIKAKVQFEGVLEIEPDRESAKKELLEIDAELEKQEALQIEQQEAPQINIETQLINFNNNHIRTWIRKPAVLVGTIAAAIALVGGGIFRVYQPLLTLTSCSEGQKKVNGSCVSTKTTPGTPNSTPTPTPYDNIQNNISSGDRILFTTKHDTSRDQAIEAFKKGDYPQAVEFFEKAVTHNRNDPEVRIYYNNAKAIDKAQTGEEYSPLILAVVVPGNDESKAQEILRGVAQSQQQFNVNGGQNGRLLEILIANDADEEEQAKKIAESLVKKESLLGVIGHGSSKTTQAALNIYKRVNIPIISPTSTANTLQGNNFFRTTPSDAAFGEKLGKYVANSSLKKVVIFYNPTSIYSKSLKEEFRNNFPGQIRLIDLTDPQLDIEKELNESASQQVQAVMLFPDIKYTATAMDVAKANNVNNNLRLKLFGGDSLYNNKTLEDGKNVQGLVLAVPWFREAPQAKDFSQAAKQQWEGDISWRTATSYDATQAFIQSLSYRPSRAGILQGLQKLNLSPKLTSGDDLKFKNGERQSKAILVTVEQGQFKCLQQCSP